MEVMTFAGLPAVLFLSPPAPEDLSRFPGLRAVIVAGTARARSPLWMDRHLPPVFDALSQLDAPLVHYKICSTLDSSPDVGSIGRAIDLGLVRFPTAIVPLLVAAPPMRRYQVFGHLFAAGPGGVFRLDRHPVMSRHPVTPMAESDVAVHVGRQTALTLGTLDLQALTSDATARERCEAAESAGVRILCIDTMDDAHLARSGGLIWDRRGKGAFCVGSQGIEYALVAHWRAQGLVPPASPVASLGRVDQMAVVSGSLSPVTAAQIAWAVDNGFVSIPVDASALLDTALAGAAAEAAAISAACDALDQGSIPIVTSANVNFSSASHSTETINDRIGSALGRILDAIVARTGIRRAVIAGGDTSGIAVQTLGITALTALAPTLPGAPICRAYANAAHLDGLELALKGGQMGGVGYFGHVRDGGGT
jgi:uncharacterized protein YgbK (DUF1537 family)